MDASQFGIGAVLYQLDPGYTGQPLLAPDKVKRFISFYSHALNPTQRNYSATKRELLAIVSALRAWDHYLYGRHFTLFTDHSALTYLFTTKSRQPMVESWIDHLTAFDFSVVHVPGKKNVIPDALSRLYPPHLDQGEAVPAPKTRMSINPKRKLRRLAATPEALSRPPGTAWVREGHGGPLRLSLLSTADGIRLRPAALPRSGKALGLVRGPAWPTRMGEPAVVKIQWGQVCPKIPLIWGS